jgi:hypothetical protein
MGLEQFQRGMRHRFKYIQLRLRLQVRHMAMHRKARQDHAACEAASSAAATNRPAISAGTSAANDTPPTSLPTLRRSGSRKDIL